MTLPTIALFEGPDGCGKSTLIQHVADQLAHHDDYPFIISLGPPRTDPPFVELSNDLALSRRRGGTTLYDRSYIGELVYKKVFRPHAVGLDGGEIIHLMLQAEQVETLNVFMLPNPKTLHDRHLDRVARGDASGFDVDAFDNFHTIYSAWERAVTLFRAFAPRTTMVFRGDECTAPPEELAAIVAARILNRSQRFGTQSSREQSKFAVGIGNNVAPKFAIVGDRMHDYSKTPAPNSPEWDEYPWSMRTPFDGGTEGKFFRNALGYALEDLYGGVHVHDIYVTYAKKDNVDAASSIVRLRQELMYVRAPKILCLGDHAHERVLKVGGEFGFGDYAPEIVKLPAPGRWSRMNDHRPAAVGDYGVILKGHLK